MQGMSEQIAMHFETTIDLRLSQMDAMLETTRPIPSEWGDALEEVLTDAAQTRGFDCLSLYSGDGDRQMIYGSTVELADPDSFWASLRKGEKKAAVGVDADGEKRILMGVPAAYPMDGRRGEHRPGGGLFRGIYQRYPVPE